ncbi:MAG: hypothetical protein R3C02_20380 [Planctomycetaceae bacterium]
MIALATIIGGTITQFLTVWPKTYQPRIVELMNDFNAWIDRISEERTWIKELEIENWFNISSSCSNQMSSTNLVLA